MDSEYSVVTRGAVVGGVLVGVLGAFMHSKLGHGPGSVGGFGESVRMRKPAPPKKFRERRFQMAEDVGFEPTRDVTPARVPGV